jgi:hypothetical protein
MKESRFNELVNLYIDRQITRAEATELEDELRDNPERRRIYVQHCRVHRATKMVYESFREHGEPRQAELPNHDNIALFENRQRSRRYRWLYAVGGAAAAIACLSVISLRHAASNETVAPETAMRAQLPAAAEVAATRLPPMGRETPAAEPGLLSLRNTFALEVSLQPWLENLRASPRGLTMPAEITPLASAPLFDDRIFAPGSLLQADQRGVFRAPDTNSPQAPREFTAFQFQR